jgi:hypothetical protein
MTNQEAVNQEATTTQKQFYVYLHSAPERGVFYVGKGDKKRCKRIPRLHNIHHSRIINKYGIDNITVTMIPCDSEQQAFELEIAMISSMKKAGVKLTNMTEGGEGASGFIHTEESKVKISIAASIRSEPFRKTLYEIAKREAIKKMTTQIINDPSIMTTEIENTVHRIVERHSKKQKGCIAQSLIKNYSRAYRNLSKDDQKSIIKNLIDRNLIKEIVIEHKLFKRTSVFLSVVDQLNKSNHQ